VVVLQRVVKSNAPWVTVLRGPAVPAGLHPKCTRRSQSLNQDSGKLPKVPYTSLR
jgi:hypothetical protein